MTNEEAIKYWRDFLGEIPTLEEKYIEDEGTVNMFREQKIATKLAISALEKRIPKKPKMKTTVAKQTKVWFCSCGEMFWGYKEKTPFCPHCGQALDWSEEEE